MPENQDVTNHSNLARFADLIDRDLQLRLDQLYNKGREDEWPKEIMNYLMWWEHETIRISWRARELAQELRK